MERRLAFGGGVGLCQALVIAVVVSLDNSGESPFLVIGAGLASFLAGLVSYGLVGRDAMLLRVILASLSVTLLTGIVQLILVFVFGGVLAAGIMLFRIDAYGLFMLPCLIFTMIWTCFFCSTYRDSGS